MLLDKFRHDAMGHGAMKVNNASIVLNTVCTLKTFTDYFDRFFYVMEKVIINELDLIISLLLCTLLSLSIYLFERLELTTSFVSWPNIRSLILHTL